jgi:heptosyltransferase III
MLNSSRTYCAPRRIGYPLQLLDRVVDTYANRFYKRRTRPQTDITSPHFLFTTSGHLGDALTLSYLFPLVKRKYPTCVIDVIAGSWCDPILTGNPYIRRLIHLNHANTNRSNKTRLAKWNEHIRTTQRALKQVQQERYTASIDIRFSDSPMHFLLPFLQVEKTVGFGTRGLGGLLDHEYFLPRYEFHHLAVILEELQSIGIRATLSDVQPYFSSPPAARVSLAQKFPALVSTTNRLLLICPESGASSRFLPDRFWRTIVQELLRQTDCQLVVCGQLPRTVQLLAAIAEDNPDQSERVVNTIGQLTLVELATLAGQAQAAITLDSLPAHLCSIYCPTLSYFQNGTGIQFFPLGNYRTQVYHNHRNSLGAQFDWKNFSSEYVSAFDGQVEEKSLNWIHSILAD